jgi:hypothetical protein
MKNEDSQTETKSRETPKSKPESPGDKQGPPRVTLRVQTPRGLWSATEPASASKRPNYPISTKIETIIADAREVFSFVESDNKYVLLHGTERLAPERTIASYRLEDSTLLVLSVQGGNA